MNINGGNPQSGRDKLSVLILDDEKIFTSELREFLEKKGFTAVEANLPDEGLKILKKETTDLLILDVRLPGISGLDILKEVKKEYTDLEVIIVSAHGDMDTVIKAMQAGAIDYLRKPFRHLDIQMAIERTQKYLLLQRKLKNAEERSSLISKNLVDQIDREFIGVSRKILDVLELAMTTARFPDTNVLITGESGTGKENIARIIHYSSARKDHLLWAVNSSAITDSLLESEFFGHKKGSFTGAINDKKGFFEICDKGTLFMDEIADMPANLQAKVLRAIEEKQITRVGDTHPVKTDFRIISATNHNLDELVISGRFRLDLIHRLNTIHIHIPSLRERPDDIEPLLNHFIKYFSVRFNKLLPEIDRNIIKVLEKYEFPGNIRELKNMAERAVILCKNNKLTLADFPVKEENHLSVAVEGQPAASLDQNEKEFILQMLEKHNYHQIDTAEALSVTRQTLIRKMKKFDITIRKKAE